MCSQCFFSVCIALRDEWPERQSRIVWSSGHDCREVLYTHRRHLHDWNSLSRFVLFVYLLVWFILFRALRCT